MIIICWYLPYFHVSKIVFFLCLPRTHALLFSIDVVLALLIWKGALCTRNATTISEYVSQLQEQRCIHVPLVWFNIENDSRTLQTKHDDVSQWKHFPRYWPFVRGIHRSLLNSPQKGQWRGALMFSLIFVYSTVDQRKHQSSTSLAFVRGIHRWPVNSPHKWPVTRER